MTEHKKQEQIKKLIDEMNQVIDNVEMEGPLGIDAREYVQLYARKLQELA